MVDSPECGIVWITGAAGGIGRAIVNHFARQNWQVIGLDARPWDGDFPAGGLFIQCDLSELAQIERAVAQVRQFTPKLDALVNNAALQVAKPLLQTSVEEWDVVMAVNLRAAFLLAQKTFPLMQANHGGAIVNVSSVHALVTSADIAAYAASKGGLLALTRAMAIEFAPHNIRVNALLPGAVDTPMLRAGLSRGHVRGASISARLNDLAAKTVIGRVGTPEEIAQAAYFLADASQSSFMTGQALVVDGGATARLSTE